MLDRGVEIINNTYPLNSLLSHILEGMTEEACQNAPYRYNQDTRRFLSGR